MTFNKEMISSFYDTEINKEMISSFYDTKINKEMICPFFIKFGVVKEASIYRPRTTI
jgi:hypothetical protein